MPSLSTLRAPAPHAKDSKDSDFKPVDQPSATPPHPAPEDTGSSGGSGGPDSGSVGAFAAAVSQFQNKAGPKDDKGDKGDPGNDGKDGSDGGSDFQSQIDALNSNDASMA